MAAGILAGALAFAIWQLTGGPSRTRSTGPADPLATPAEAEPTPGLPWFVDVTSGSGIDFVHFDSSTPAQYIHETMGSGLGWIDYDNDGWLDLFCVQDGPARSTVEAGPLPTSKLYHNNGDGTFTDVTAQVGLARPGYGMGCAVGDFDNDGYDDLVVTYFGEVVLYHNEPDGRGGRRFVDVTAKAGLHNPHWGTSCAWGDIDGDGFLDLYVCNYVEVNLDRYPNCAESRTKLPYTCPPPSSPAPRTGCTEITGTVRSRTSPSLRALRLPPPRQGWAWS